MVKTKSKRFYLDSLFGQLHVRETRPNNEESKPKRPVICFHQSPLSGTQYKVFQNELGLLLVELMVSQCSNVYYIAEGI